MTQIGEAFGRALSEMWRVELIVLMIRYKTQISGIAHFAIALYVDSSERIVVLLRVLS